MSCRRFPQVFLHPPLLSRRVCIVVCVCVCGACVWSARFMDMKTVTRRAGGTVRRRDQQLDGRGVEGGFDAEAETGTHTTGHLLGCVNAPLPRHSPSPVEQV